MGTAEVLVLAIIWERHRRLLKEVQRNMKYGSVTILTTKFDNFFFYTAVFDVKEIL